MSLDAFEKLYDSRRLSQKTYIGIRDRTINLLKTAVRAVVFAAKLAGPATMISSCINDETNVPPSVSVVERQTESLTIDDFHPPRAPFVLPLQNGVATRVSQKANENCQDCTHNRANTQNAVDFSDETFSLQDQNDDHDARAFALAPFSGTVHRNGGNCNAIP